MMQHNLFAKPFSSSYTGFQLYKQKKLETKAQDSNLSFYKRTFDLTFSILVILCVFSWLYPLIALIIKLTSRGPILFVQERVGINNTVFKCYKFRTMKTTWKKNAYSPTAENDCRITPVGSFLRRTNLDEFPQFINVLKGDMSIVGPRPHAVSFHNTYADFIDCIDDRLLVKPGITGLAQIRGYRGDVLDFEENKFKLKKRVRFDIYYIKTWKFKLDLWIIYKTFEQMICRKTKGH